MKKYLKIYTMGIKNAKVFKADYYFRIMTVPVELVVSYLFWKGILKTDSAINLSSLINYYLYVQILQLAFSSAMYVTFELWNDINSGTIIVWLNRPVYYPVYILAQKLAIFSLNMISVLIIGLAVSTVSGIVLNPQNVLLGCISSLFGYIILYQLQFLIGELTFWLKKVIVLRDLIMSVLFLVGGIMLPIELTPLFIQKITYLTPIPYIYFVPAKIFSCQFTGSTLFYNLFIQLLWIIIFQTSISLLWYIGTKDNITQGA